MRIVLIFFGICILAIFSLNGIKNRLLPNETNNILAISFSLPNASPRKCERDVTSKIESICSQVRQLKHISSVSGSGRGTVLLEFDKNADMPFIQMELTGIIRRVYPQLPAGTSYPVVSASGGSDHGKKSLLLEYNISAPVPADHIYEKTFSIFNESLAGIPGLEDVDMSGRKLDQIVILLNSQRCKQWRVNPLSVTNVIRQTFSYAQINSTVKSDGRLYFISLNAPDSSIEVMKNISILNEGSKQFRLSDVADIYFEKPASEERFRVNGNNAVVLRITASNSVNRIRLSETVKRKIEIISNALPDGYQINLVSDEILLLDEAINRNYKRAALSVVILIFFIFLAYRSAFFIVNMLAGLAIAISMAVLMSRIAHLDIHLYTIAGFAIAFGVMLDSAIVMLDHYDQHRNSKIIRPLIASTFTSVAALSICYFFSDEMKVYITDFATIVIFSLISSLLTAGFFTPAFYEMFHKKFNKIRIRKDDNYIWVVQCYSAIIFRIAGYRNIIISCTILLFGVPFFLLPPQLEGNEWYRRLYNNSIGNPAYYEYIHPYLSKYAGGTLRLFAENVYEHFSFRSPTSSKLNVHVSLPKNNTVELLDTIMTDFEHYLSGIKGVSHYQTVIRYGPKADVEISFSDHYENSSFPIRLQENLRSYFLYKDGLSYSVYGSGDAFSNTQPPGQFDYLLTMRGYNYDQLDQYIDRLVNKLKKNRRVNDIDAYASSERRMEYILKLDMWKMSLLDISYQSLQQSLNSDVGNTGPVARMPLNGKYYAIHLKGDNERSYAPTELLHAVIYNNSGKSGRLAQVGILDYLPAAEEIRKRDKQYLRTIGYNYTGSAEAGAIYTGEIREQMHNELASGYYIDVDNQSSSSESKNRRGFLVFILLSLIFLICCILFESISQPFAVIFCITSSFIGIFSIYVLGGFGFDQGGFAAFILLGAIVANSSILVVNEFNELKSVNLNADTNPLIIEAICKRSRTIILTTISSCCGLIPFVIGRSEFFWHSLAIAGIGGLLFSLVSIFVILPVLLWKSR